MHQSDGHSSEGCPGPCVRLGTASTKLECQLAGIAGEDAAGNLNLNSDYCALVWFERDHSCYMARRCDGLTMLDRAWTLPLDGSSAPANNHPPPPPPPPRSPPPPPPHHGDARFGTPEDVCRPVSFSYDPTPYTALVAHGQCRSRGGSLASIHSQFDEATINGMIPHGAHVWIVRQIFLLASLLPRVPAIIVCHRGCTISQEGIAATLKVSASGPGPTGQTETVSHNRARAFADPDANAGALRSLELQE